MAQGKIKSLEQVYLFSLAVKEYQIVDFFLGSALKDEVMKIMPVQKQTRAGQRTRFKVRARAPAGWRCCLLGGGGTAQVAGCGACIGMGQRWWGGSAGGGMPGQWRAGHAAGYGCVDAPLADSGGV